MNRLSGLRIPLLPQDRQGHSQPPKRRIFRPVNADNLQFLMLEEKQQLRAVP